MLCNGVKKHLHVGEFSDNEGLSIFGVPYDRDKTSKTFEIAQKVYEVSSDIKRIGPSSLDICMVAEGKAKLYFEFDLYMWDTFAATVILLEAGGDYSSIDGFYIFGTDEVLNKYREAVYG